MKLNILIFGFISSLLLFIACDDNLNSVGLSTMPNNDKVDIQSDTIFLGEKYTTTIKSDPIFTYFDVTGFASDYYTEEKSCAFLLGSYYDPSYGSFKADFITNFNSKGRFQMDGTASVIDTVLLTLNYYSWVGDSLENMVAKVYPAKKLTTASNFQYTDIALHQHAEPTLWASKQYTARDMTIPDSVYSSSYLHSLTFDITNCKMPQTNETIAKTFYDKWKISPTMFDTISSFQNFFYGVYVTTTGGNGSLLKIHDAVISFKYKYTYTDSDSGAEIDSTATTYIASSKNIVQSSQYVVSTVPTLPIEQLNLDTSYIWSPAGVFTQYTIPLEEIRQKMDNRIINTVKLKVAAYPKEYSRHALNTPTKLLLIKADSLKSYFSKAGNKMGDLVTYKASYSNYAYNFGDISKMIRKELGSNTDAELKLVLVPVSERLTYANSYLTGTETAYDITPSAVRLRTGRESLRLEILSSKMTDK